MAMNEPFDWRRADRRLFAAVAVLFPAVVLIGFARTYYLKFAFGTPPLPSLLVHVHGLLMTLWVGYFIAQVWLIRSKQVKTHMSMGMLGIALAMSIVVVGFFTAAAAAKYGSPSTPPGIDPMTFFVVPFFDIIIFAGFFAFAIYYRYRPADHKRLMLLTVINFLPPAVGRIPVAALQSLGPLLFMGVPTCAAIGLVIYDTWRNRRLNIAFLVGAIVLIVSFPLRIVISGTAAWSSFASWITSWAA